MPSYPRSTPGVVEHNDRSVLCRRERGSSDAPVMYVTLLLWAGAWSGPIDPSRIGPALRDAGWVDLTWFVAASLAVALLIHPLKFGTTQLLEGYWGSQHGRAQAHRRRGEATPPESNAAATRSDQEHVRWVVRGSALWRNEEQTPDPSTVRGPDLENREEDALRGLSSRVVKACSPSMWPIKRTKRPEPRIPRTFGGSCRHDWETYSESQRTGLENSTGWTQWLSRHT